MELRPWTVLLGLTLLPSLALAAGKCERLVITGSPDAPPLLWRDPQDPTHLIGATADVLQQVGKDLGLKVDLLYGGKRSVALDEVRSGRMDILADAPLNLGELETLDYIHPALVQLDYLVCHLFGQLSAQPRIIAGGVVGNSQVQAWLIDGHFAGDQVIAHSQGLSHGHAGITAGEDVVHFTQQQFLEGRGQARQALQSEMLAGERLKIGAQASALRDRPLVTMQVWPKAASTRCQRWYSRAAH